jgi:hypothetical protein
LRDWSSDVCSSDLKSFNQTLGIYICAYKDKKLRSCSGTVETNNDDFTILNNIKRIGIELSINKNNYKDMHFPKLDASELNKLTFPFSQRLIDSRVRIISSLCAC